MSEADGVERVTADDVAGLNRSAVTRAAFFARWVGTVLVIGGVILLAAAVWTSVRLQQRLDERSGSAIGGLETDADDPTLLDRTDVFAQGLINWTLPALVIGGGLGLRLFADYSMARTGGSISGFEPGDPVPGGDEDDDADGGG
jgi:hypothetical protein